MAGNVSSTHVKRSCGRNPDHANTPQVRSRRTSGSVWDGRGWSMGGSLFPSRPGLTAAAVVGVGSVGVGGLFHVPLVRGADPLLLRLGRGLDFLEPELVPVLPGAIDDLRLRL